MAQGATVRVEGLRELTRDFGKLEHRLRGELQRELKTAAEPVAEDARRRAVELELGGRTVSGIRTRARGASAYVEQSERKRTGLRPDYGSLQMRKVFLPALARNTDEVIRGLEEMLDRLTSEHGFGRGGRL